MLYPGEKDIFLLLVDLRTKTKGDFYAERREKDKFVIDFRKGWW